ncbi:MULTISPECIES: DUF664 domain-containing protein [unclassified Brachybacterium]|uniref:mycothiol transferase n=1 Tax=unclassified Brachybacterium TaxID=2623841 RepID=UPI003607B384
MPFLTADITTEHDGLATFALQQYRQLATALHGLNRDQLAATPSASAMSLGALARHAILMVENVTAGILAAPGNASEPEREPAQAYAEGTIDPSAVREGDTAESLSAELDAVASRLAEAIRAADLETSVPVPDRPWFVGCENWTVRWCALHAIEEGARHAGHADILRESIDGKGAYELNALAEGQPWPPPGW